MEVKGIMKKKGKSFKFPTKVDAERHAKWQKENPERVKLIKQLVKENKELLDSLAKK